MSTQASKPPSSPGSKALHDEQRFRALIENAYDVVILNDQEGHIIYTSPSVRRVLGYTPEEFMGLHASQVIHPDDQHAMTTLFASLLKKDQDTVATQYRVRHKNGTWRWIEGTWKNLLNNPQVEAVVINVHDITERKNAEEAMQLQATLLANISDAVFSTDLDHTITSWNKAAETLYGWQEQEVLGKNAYVINPPVIGQEVIETITQELRERGEWRGEITQQRKDGTYLHVSASTALIKDTGGTAIGYVTVNRDITEQQHSRKWQRLLNEASNVLASSLDHQITLQEIAELIVPAIADYCRIAIVDESLRITEIQVNHIDPQKTVLVQSLYEQYKDRDSSTHGLQRVLERGRPELITKISAETVEPVQDNPTLIYIINALELKSYMGIPLIAREKIIGAITFSSVQPHRHYSHDDLVFGQELARRIALALDNARLYHEAQAEIAERKQTEAKLRQSEERYRLVVENTTDLIVVLDMQGIVVYVSPSCETLLGYKPEEMIGQSAFSFNHPDDLPHVESEFMKVFQGGVATVPHYRSRHKDGRWISFAATGSAVFDDQGHPFLIVSTSHDITQRIELERRKDEFISMASHELKTPVTSLKGFLAILQKRLSDQGLVDERTQHYLHRMDVQLDRLTKLVSELLDISRMQTSKLDYREEPFDLAALVEEVVENVQETTRTHHLLIESLVPAQVFADRDRIGQVLMNLLSNAVKYSSQADTVLVRVSTDQKCALVSIQDFGIGINEEYYQKIFERFYQVNEPLEKTFPGLGIGLYLSHEIIKRHEGAIWVRSGKGEGSTFYFTLPLLKEK